MSRLEQYLSSNARRLCVKGDSNSLLDGFADHFGLEFGSSLEYDKLELNSFNGTGGIERIRVQPGLDLFLLDFSLAQTTLVESHNTPTEIELGFWLRGSNVRYYYDFDEGVTQPQQAFLTLIPTAYSGEVVYPANERFQGVKLSIATDVFQNWLTDQLCLPGHLERSLFARKLEFVMHQTHIVPNLMIALTQLLQHMWRGPMFKLYLEGKVLEIISLYVNQLRGHLKIPVR